VERKLARPPRTDLTIGALVSWRYHLFPTTMQIKGVQMAGLPAKTVRDMLRRLNIIP